MILIQRERLIFVLTTDQLCRALNRVRLSRCVTCTIVTGGHWTFGDHTEFTRHNRSIILPLGVTFSIARTLLSTNLVLRRL